MSSWGKKLIFLTFCALTSGAAFGQNWPFPAKTANTDVVCNTSGCDSAQRGKKLWPYSLPISTFVGRYADNTKQQWEFFPTGTARAKWMWFSPKNNRIYTVLGGILVAWDWDTFFTRLASGEQMVDIGRLAGLGAGSKGVEKVFNDDRMFHAPDVWGASGADGERQIFHMDWDDRGYLYVAAGSVGWGIVKDDLGKGGGQMPSSFVDKSGATECLVVKTSDGSYYALVGDSTIRRVFSVTDPSNPKDVGGGVPPFGGFAKSSDGSRIAVVNVGSGGSIRIYSNDTIVRGGSPIATFSGNYGNLTSDGTNFFAGSIDSNSHPVVTVISPTPAGSYSKATYSFPSITVNTGIVTGISVFSNPDSGGYLTMIAYESAYNGNNVRLFKISNLVPTEVDLGGYVARHYGKQSSLSGYTNPGLYSELIEAHVLKRGTKYYLIISDYGLGDVYEIKGADFLTAKLKAFGKMANANSRAAVNSGPFYGDEIKFTSEFSGTVAPSVTWNFGDSVQTTVTPGTAGAPDVVHQYGGLTASQLPITYTAAATHSADATVTSSVNVTLAKPTVRVGVLNTSILFTQATTDLTLPIVSSDVLYDGSDGAVEGHYSEWKLSTDTASTKLLPNQTFSVGGLGERDLTFTGHYGPYTATFTGTADAALSITPIRYKVRAFAPAINGPLAAAPNVVFRSSTRVTTNTAHLANGAATVVAYKWELLNDQNALVGTALTGSSALSAVPDFTLARTAFAGAQNWKVRLSLTLDNTTETALSGLLNGPAPGAIQKSGCGEVGQACSFQLPSLTPVNDSSMTYAWSVAGTNLAGTEATFTPVFPSAGTYTVSVTVANALGEAVPVTLSVTVLPSSCRVIRTALNTAITYKGRTSNCIDTTSPCALGEIIDMWVTGPAQDCDTYSWSFGDGASNSTLKMPTHVYNQASTFTISATITSGPSSLPVTRQIRVGGDTGGGGGNGGGNGGGGNGGGGGGGGGACTVLAPPINVFASWSGNSSGCSGLSGNCTTGETVTFRMGANGYNYACAGHTFTWNFGDGTGTQTTTDSATALNHTYATAGSFPLEVLISNGTASATYSRVVTVVTGTGGGGGNGGGGGGNGGGGGGTGTTCGTMTPGLNVSISYNGPSSGCSGLGGTCAQSENIAFQLSTLGYNLSCTTHSYEWDFGDNSAKSSLQNPTHAYTVGGDYPVVLKITRLDGQTATLNRTVKVAGTNNCPTMVANQNIIMQFQGLKSHCATSGGNCQEDESVAFGIIGYNFSCSAHTFRWTFGDGSESTEQNPVHIYTTPGEYNVTLRITNSKQEFQMSQKITVSPEVTKRRSTRH